MQASAPIDRLTRQPLTCWLWNLRCRVLNRPNRSQRTRMFRGDLGRIRPVRLRATPSAARRKSRSPRAGSSEWLEHRFRRGIDLFNAGYYWEAHEVWEEVWHACGRRGTRADILRALIKLAAAGVKVREQQEHGVRTHAQRSRGAFGVCARMRRCETIRPESREIDRASPRPRNQSSARSRASMCAGHACILVSDRAGAKLSRR